MDASKISRRSLLLMYPSVRLYKQQLSRPPSSPPPPSPSPPPPPPSLLLPPPSPPPSPLTSPSPLDSSSLRLID
uniref:Uncharacterized protein n=1 Tax=Knipowitschia caucasica TaxID=637954 RepID=A0AAV2L357_KNICA